MTETSFTVYSKNAGVVLDIVDLVYETVHKPTLWGAVAEKISEALGGDSLGLYASFPESKTPAVLGLGSMPHDVWDSFSGYYAAINPVMQACERLFSPEDVWLSHLAITDQALERSECYNDFYRPNRMHYFAGLRIELPNHIAANFSCQRSKELGPFDCNEAEILLRLRPHLSRALQLHTQLNHLHSLSIAAQSALDAFDHAVLGLNGQARIVMANARFESILRQQSVLCVKNGRLVASDLPANLKLQKAINSVLNQTGDSCVEAVTSIALPQENNDSPLHLTVTPYHCGSFLGRPTIRALLFLSPSMQPRASRTSVLRTLFALTPAEARIAEKIAAGLELKDIADQLGITFATARIHMKRILSKTGVNRQTQLVAFVLSLPGQLIR